LDVFAEGAGFDGELRTWLVAASQHWVGLSRTWADVGTAAMAAAPSPQSVVIVVCLMARSSDVRGRLDADERPTPGGVRCSTQRAPREGCFA
jgi:hypothetical protein